MSLYHFHFTRKSLIDRAASGVYLSSKVLETPLGYHVLNEETN